MKQSYGKHEVSVFRTRGDGGLFAAEVDVDLIGDAFGAAYDRGDNSAVIATDSMKNLVHATAFEHEGDSLEEFLQLVGERFLSRYEQVERVDLRARRPPWTRLGGRVFQRDDGDYDEAELSLDRDGVREHRSGRCDIRLVKVAGSAFTGFVRDEYTTLPETADRPLNVRLDVHWRYLDWSRREGPPEPLASFLADVFETFESASIQHLVYEQGVRLLEAAPALAEVSFRAENRTWDAAAATGPEGDVRVYTEARPPYGVIRLTLQR